MPSNISRNQNQCTKRRLGWWTYLSQSIIFFLDKPWFLLLSVSLECKHVACVVFFCHVSQATMGKKCLVGLAISKFQIYLNMSCWNVWKFMYEDFVPFVFGPIRFFFLTNLTSSAFHPRDVQPTPRPPPTCWAMATDLAPEGPIEWEAPKIRHRTCEILDASNGCVPHYHWGCCGEIPIDVPKPPTKIYYQM